MLQPTKTPKSPIDTAAPCLCHIQDYHALQDIVQPPAKMVWTDLVRSIFDLYLQEDKTVILRPWDSTCTMRSLASANNLPYPSNNASWKNYAGGLGTSSFGHDIWCSLHWGYTVDHKNFQWSGSTKTGLNPNPLAHTLMLSMNRARK